MRFRIPLLAFSLIFIIVTASQTAFAADPAANFVVGLFIKACVPNMGQPDKVRAWADQWHLHEITDPAPLKIFVGDGSHGIAWAVPAKPGSFALSIRGTTQACAVWARAAEPTEVETDFKKIIDGVQRPGLTITKINDVTSQSPVGQVHELVYQIVASGASSGFLFSMLTSQQPGSAFQASLQVAATKLRP